MYKKGQLELKLDAVITEFCDIYAPIAQLLKTETKRKSFLQYED